MKNFWIFDNLDVKEIMDLLLKDPTVPQCPSLLSRRSGFSDVKTVRILKKLLDAKIVTKHSSGSQTFYQLSNEGITEKISFLENLLYGA